MVFKKITVVKGYNLSWYAAVIESLWKPGPDKYSDRYEILKRVNKKKKLTDIGFGNGL